jgi:hypothetical protein
VVFSGDPSKGTVTMLQRMWLDCGIGCGIMVTVGGVDRFGRLAVMR